MNVSPKVSIVTIFFNAEKFLDQAVESVFAQTYDDWELLLVDDGSTDMSSEIAKTYSDNYPDKVKYVDHDGHRNLGMSAARNLGIRSCGGEYVAFLDADDVWLPNKLERQLAILESKPQVAMVCGAPQYWHSWTGLREDSYRDYICDLGVRPDTIFMPPTLLHLLIEDAGAPCPSDILIRHNVIERVGGFEDSFQGMFEDQALLAKVYLTEPVFVSNECLDRYRIHPKSCVSVVTRSGDYDKVRLFFLGWLEAYLFKERERHPDVWAGLQNVLGSFRNSNRNNESEKTLQGQDIRQGNWWLRVGAGNLACLEFLSDDWNMVRLRIEKAATTVPSDIQLNKPRLKVRANHRYAVNFRGRADRPREILLGCAESYTPWSNLGLYNEIQLTSEWQYFERQFVATGKSTNARIHFDVGRNTTSVDLSTLQLRSLVDGRLIEPAIPSMNWPLRQGCEPLK
jgi:glycosyltransferase involved in cell wall biosynthesis